MAGRLGGIFEPTLFQEYVFVNVPMLLTPVDHPVLGRLNSRVAMSAMTRGFASDDHLGNSSIGSYYTRRAAAGVGADWHGP